MSDMELTKTCVVCKNQFVVSEREEKRKNKINGKGRIVCSRQCSNKLSTTRVELSCQICKKQFKVVQSRKETAKVCSRECYQVARQAKLASVRANNNVELSCKGCGKNFSVVPSRKETAKYCSKKCSSAFGGKEKYKGCTARWANHKKIELSCECCGKIFNVPPCRKEKTKYCSHECARTAKANQKPKENSTITKTCVVCKKDFTFSAFEEKYKNKLGKTRVICSRECVYKQRSILLGYDPFNLERTCKGCGKTFTVEKPGFKTKFCSSQCFYSTNAELQKSNKWQIQDEIKKHRATHSQKQTCEKFQIVPGLLRRMGAIDPKAQMRYNCPEILPESLKEVIIGNLLGDGCLPLIPEGTTYNTNFIITQKIKNIDYMNSLYEIYQPFSRPVRTGKSKKPLKLNKQIYHDPNTNEYLKFCQMYTVHHPVFSELREKWYANKHERKSQKIIPRDFILTWKILAFWAADDGYNCTTVPPSRKSIFPPRRFVLYTESFTYEDVEYLVYRLKEDLSLNATISKRLGKYVIILSGENQVNLVKGIAPYIPWSCFAHKILWRESGKPYQADHKDSQVQMEEVG